MDYNASTYGDAWAEIYDDPVLGWTSPVGEVEFLAQRAEGGPVLDLGAGTGRTAVPLAERGIEVWAVDASEPMLERLRSKASDNVTAVHGDMRTTSFDTRFSMAYCVGQSFLQLPDQQAQEETLRNAAAHLLPGGSLVLELLTPDIRRFRVGQDFLTNKVLPDRVLFTASLHDPMTQTIRSMTIDVGSDGYRLYPNFIRYVWHEEVRLLARSVGLEHVGSYSTWEGHRYRGGPGAYAIEFRTAVK